MRCEKRKSLGCYRNEHKTLDLNPARFEIKLCIVGLKTLCTPCYDKNSLPKAKNDEKHKARYVDNVSFANQRNSDLGPGR